MYFDSNLDELKLSPHFFISKYSFSVNYWDLNSQTIDYTSSPIANRPYTFSPYFITSFLKLFLLNVLYFRYSMIKQPSLCKRDGQTEERRCTFDEK